jgi:hypothetical protein
MSTLEKPKPVFTKNEWVAIIDFYQVVGPQLPQYFMMNHIFFDFKLIDRDNTVSK